MKRIGKFLCPLPLEVLALSPHDTEASARQVFRAAFPDLYQDVEVGRPIRVGA